VFYLGFNFRVSESKFRVGVAYSAHPADKSLVYINIYIHSWKAKVGQYV
jgi:hypothetical protein